MSLRAWVKSKVADKVLSPVREELIDLITPGSTLLDIGSGTGDLLFKSAPRLKKGCGIDIDEGMVNFAEKKRRRAGLANIEFICGDIRDVERNNYDISTSTLCLHEVGVDTACEILDFMVNHSREVLIADYTTAKTLTAKIGIEADEFLSGHYGNYRKYKKCGEVPCFAQYVGASTKETIRTNVDGISIWVIDGKVAHP